jgi:hypothetical protein
MHCKHCWMSVLSLANRPLFKHAEKYKNANTSEGIADLSNIL